MHESDNSFGDKTNAPVLDPTTDERSAAYALYFITFPVSIFLIGADQYQQQKPTHRSFFSSIQNAGRYRQDLPRDCQTHMGPFQDRTVPLDRSRDSYRLVISGSEHGRIALRPFSLIIQNKCYQPKRFPQYIPLLYPLDSTMQKV
jgi:hypothetical protein